MRRIELQWTRLPPRFPLGPRRHIHWACSRQLPFKIDPRRLIDKTSAQESKTIPRLIRPLRLNRELTPVKYLRIRRIKRPAVPLYSLIPKPPAANPPLEPLSPTEPSLQPDSAQKIHSQQRLSRLRPTGPFIPIGWAQRRPGEGKSRWSAGALSKSPAISQDPSLAATVPAVAQPGKPQGSRNIGRRSNGRDLIRTTIYPLPARKDNPRLPASEGNDSPDPKGSGPQLLTLARRPRRKHRSPRPDASQAVKGKSGPKITRSYAKGTLEDGSSSLSPEIRHLPTKNNKEETREPPTQLPTAVHRHIPKKGKQPKASQPVKPKGDQGVKSKITVDALLNSIKFDPSSALNTNGLVGEQAVQLRKANNPTISPARESNRNLYHVLCLENCGTTMIKSDIERIFSNHEALVKGWNPGRVDIMQIVPSRNPVLLHRTDKYYIHYHTRSALAYHMEHFTALLKSNSKTNFMHITLPHSQYQLSTSNPSLGTTKLGSKGSSATLKPLAPQLSPVKVLPKQALTSNVLYESGGSPGRTVLVLLNAHTDWQIVQVWLRYEVLEKHEFGRWMVTGGDSKGFGLQTLGQPLGGHRGAGRWIVRFAIESEAERMVREWDGRWVNVRGSWGMMKVELLW